MWAALTRNKGTRIKKIEHKGKNKHNGFRDVYTKAHVGEFQYHISQDKGVRTQPERTGD